MGMDKNTAQLSQHNVEILSKKIEIKTAKVGVIGLGYVGLPLAVEKGKVGFGVIGIDRNDCRVDQINKGENYIDVIVICVPTPLTVTRDPDISYIVNVTEEIAKYMRPGQLITLESTTYPGTTSGVILPLLEKSGYKVGEDFFLAFSPERVDPGNKRFTTQNTSKVVGGYTAACLETAKKFYEQTIVKVIPVSSPEVAEMTNVFENTYRAVNIALINELMLLCDRMKLDVWEVVDAAAKKPFGIQTFYPGPGVGGHCIPIDPFYLTWKAREYDFHTRFIELAGEINIQASYYVVQKVMDALGSQRKSVNGAKVLALGMAYKKDIEDYRESPALKVIDLLLKAGAKVVYHDKFVPEVQSHEPYTWEMQSIGLDEKVLQWADCVIILTDHSEVDYEFVVKNSKHVIDTRNATKSLSKVFQKKITKI